MATKKKRKPRKPHTRINHHQGWSDEHLKALDEYKGPAAKAGKLFATQFKRSSGAIYLKKLELMGKTGKISKRVLLFRETNPTVKSTAHIPVKRKYTRKPSTPVPASRSINLVMAGISVTVDTTDVRGLRLGKGNIHIF